MIENGYSKINFNPMSSKNNELYNLLQDPIIKKMWRRHRNNLKTVEEHIYQEIKNDSFSLSQILLGNDYYKIRINRVFNTLQYKDSILDIGCGIGNWSFAASDEFTNVIGCDVNVRRIAIAKKINDKSNVSFMVLESGDLPFADASFNAILCINMITFTDVAYEDFFKELRRITKQGGMIYVIAHVRGFLFFLLWQAIITKNVGRLRIWLRVVFHNFKFKFGLEHFSKSWVNEKHLINSAETVGWQLKEFGFEGNCVKGKQKTMWPKTLCGFPLMKEYIFTAI
jgi:ubiquinone/menaquinone biosynthesis C-methylase UbiE